MFGPPRFSHLTGSNIMLSLLTTSPNIFGSTPFAKNLMFFLPLSTLKKLWKIISRQLSKPFILIMGTNFWLYDRFFPHMVSTFSPPLRIPQSTMDTLNAGIDILSKLASLYFIVLPSLSNFGPLPLPRRCISLIACRKQTSPPTPHMKNFSNTNSPPPNFGYLGVSVFPGFAHMPPIN